MPKHVPKLHDAEWLRDAYAGRTLHQIADELGCSFTSVARALHRHGIEAKYKGRPAIDRVSQRFGRLTVIGRASVEFADEAYWTVRCDCGNEKSVRGSHLTDGTTLSCGCFAKERSSERNSTHGMGKSREFETWRHMKARCSNPNTAHYANYGGRGITVCEEWLHSFERFYADMGPKPPGSMIDRINNDGNYEPRNCRWATPTESARNRRMPKRRKNSKDTHQVA